MDYQIHSYRFAEEIIRHPKYKAAFNEIIQVVKDCPLYKFPGKSTKQKQKKYDVIQQLFNTYFDRKFACDLGWEYHPNATKIPNSNLAADYKKVFKGLRIQTEAQFGNMSRWYSDIFKFQTAYSQDLIDLGLCIVPMSSVANRIDSNITNFERCTRELPSAKLSITLPILIIGLEVGDNTADENIATTGIGKAGIGKITGKGMTANRYRIVNGIIAGTKLGSINLKSPTGAMAGGKDTADLEGTTEDDK